MSETFNLEITPEEFIIISEGVCLYHKNCAKALYEFLSNYKCINVEEFDSQHKILMNLYNKLADISKQINK